MIQIYTQISHGYQSRRLVTALRKPLKRANYSENKISSLGQTIWNFIDPAVKNLRSVNILKV